MVSEKPWKLNDVFYLLVGIFTSVCIAWLIAGLVMQFGMKEKPDPNSFSITVLSSLTLDGSILLGIVIFLRLQKINWSEAFGFFNPPIYLAIWWGLVMAIVFIPVGMLLQGLSTEVMNRVGQHPETQHAVSSLQNAQTMGTRLYMIVFAVLIAPIAEETLFRGILYPTIKKYGNARLAFWITSLGFAAIHQSMAIFIPLTVLAMMMVWLYEKTNNLLTCIAAHSLFNAINVTLLFLGEHVNK